MTLAELEALEKDDGLLDWARTSGRTDEELGREALDALPALLRVARAAQDAAKREAKGCEGCRYAERCAIGDGCEGEVELRAAIKEVTG